MTSFSIEAFLIFISTVVATFILTFFARKHGAEKSAVLGDQNLNRWLVGLSAGATANSGFIVTAAVGLGYLYGIQWLLLPFAWLLGDIFFWSLFPDRMNVLGRKVRAHTITDLVAPAREQDGHSSAGDKALPVLIGLAIIFSLMGYTAAQWLAGQKFISGAFGFGPSVSLSIFAMIIVAYTAIGGFRGSIYADSFQAIVRVFGTGIAILAIGVVAYQTPQFSANIEAAGPDFLDPFAMGSALSVLGFIAGYAFAALGFGLGQPQIVARYLAGRSAAETKSAWWIYIGFVQFTWIAMTAFGVVLRGVMPEIDDAEAGLSVFFSSYFGPVLTGIIVADIFATIAATSNSLLVSMAQSLRSDIMERLAPDRKIASLTPLVVGLGAVSMGVSVLVDTSVFNLALTSVSLLGAALAPVVALRCLGFRFSSNQAMGIIATGLLVATLWRVAGLGSLINEAAPGIFAGLIVGSVAGAVPGRRKPLDQREG